MKNAGKCTKGTLLVCVAALLFMLATGCGKAADADKTGGLPKETTTEAVSKVFDGLSLTSESGADDAIGVMDNTIDSIFMVPVWLTSERFDEIITNNDLLTPSEQKGVEMRYNRRAQEGYWNLRGDIQENFETLEELRELFAKAGYTTEDFYNDLENAVNGDNKVDPIMFNLASGYRVPIWLTTERYDEFVTNNDNLDDNAKTALSLRYTSRKMEGYAYLLDDIRTNSVTIWELHVLFITAGYYNNANIPVDMSNAPK